MRTLYRFGIVMQFKFAMVQAYLCQHYAPAAAAQWLTDADHWRMELWRFDRSLR